MKKYYFITIFYSILTVGHAFAEAICPEIPKEYALYFQEQLKKAKLSTAERYVFNLADLTSQDNNWYIRSNSRDQLIQINGQNISKYNAIWIDSLKLDKSETAKSSETPILRCHYTAQLKYVVVGH